MTAPLILADLLATNNGHLPEGWEVRAHALLLPETVAAALAAAQGVDLQHQIRPVALSGWPPSGIGADVLLEAEGIFRPIFDDLNRALASEVLVVPWQEFTSRIPPPPIEPTS